MIDWVQAGIIFLVTLLLGSLLLFFWNGERQIGRYEGACLQMCYSDYLQVDGNHYCITESGEMINIYTAIKYNDFVGSPRCPI